MTATYMHIGIPITEKKPNMIYNEAMKFWVSNVDDYDYKVEYLKFEEGTPSRRAASSLARGLRGDDLDRYVDDADRVSLRPHGRGSRCASGLRRERYGAVIELYEDKN